MKKYKLFKSPSGNELLFVCLIPNQISITRLPYDSDSFIIYTNSNEIDLNDIDYKDSDICLEIASTTPNIEQRGAASIENTGLFE